jgi:hypothetical protein
MSFTSQNEADAIVKLVAAEAPAQIFSGLILGRLVHADYAKTVAQAGDAVKIPKIGDAPQPPIVLKLEQETFQIPDVTKVLESPDLLRTHMQPALSKIAGKIEPDIAALYSNFTANPPVGSLAPISETVIDSAEALLFRAEVPPQDRFLVVSPGTFSAVRRIPHFNDANGKIRGFFVVQSESIQKPSSTTYNMGFHSGALGLAVRRLPLPIPGIGAVAKYAEDGDFGVLIVMSSPPPSFIPQITVACLYGCAVIRNNFGVQVQTDN